ncbi:MAG: hypothetical protein ABSB15_03020 [Bryobacteraceae bacterium]|jgi:uncharacterized protein (TIGR03437 family)
MFSGLYPKSVAPGWKSVILVIGLPAALLCQAASTAPSYSAASIVNAATQTAGPLAPNALATLYGTNLAFDTVAASTLIGGTLPSSLDGVSLSVGNIAAPLLFVSPGQINFIVPYDLLPDTVTVYVARQNLAGPVVTIQLNATAPGLFSWNGNQAIAIHLNGTLISADSPAHAGEIVVVYAAGLGRTSPDTSSGRIAGSAASIVAAAQMQVLLNGAPLPAASVLYAGLAPGFAGLYQINLVLPTPVPVNPQIQIAFGPLVSPASIQLAAQ